MLYRKLGRETRIRRSILAGLTKDVIKNGHVVTTDARAKEVRKFVDKMITYAKNGSLVSRRKALAFLQNDKVAVEILFNSRLIFAFVILYIFLTAPERVNVFSLPANL